MSRGGVTVTSVCVTWKNHVLNLSSCLPGDDEKLILCDDCNKAFHLFCLRPALFRIPVGEWRCLACQPTVARRGSRSR